MRSAVFTRASLTLLLLALFSLNLSAKDIWTSVKSENFYLIGNASEKDIRGVALKLEQFRETFRLIFPSIQLRQSIPTNVVVFKSSSAYNPFRPKLVNGKPDEWVAGYFQPGPDANYITLSTEGEKEDTYNTIFHEYVHFLLDTNIGKSQIPPWFNEGLAEYYSTFKMDGDRKATLGYFQQGHLDLLRETKLIPLGDLFKIDNYSLHQNGNHSRSIFYAQSWALIHYLHQSSVGGSDQLNRFINALIKNAEPEKAFRESFAMDYAAMEKLLRKYVEQHTFKSWIATFEKPLVPDAEITSAPLSEAEANAYLGDLLYHTHEYDNAEVYLKKSLALNPSSTLANTAYGLVRMRQNKFDEAKSFLEKALSSGQKNYMAHYSYAFILSRESLDEFGYVRNYPVEIATRMREELKKAISLNPNFSESYSLLGFISYVNNDEIDEAIKYLKVGLSVQPGNQEYALRVAQLYLRQEKYKEAKAVAEKLVKMADEPSTRSGAEKLIDVIKQYEESANIMRQNQKEMAARGEAPVLFERRSTKGMSQEEINRIKQESVIDSINKSLSPPKEGENLVVGRIQKIACVNGFVNYVVKTESETFTLRSKDFQSLDLMSFVEDSENIQVGCDAQLQNILMAITYKPLNDGKAQVKGNLVSLQFVPDFFRYKSAEELAKSKQVMLIEEPERSAADEEKQAKEMEQRRREAMLESIKNALRKPQPGEERIQGIPEKIECNGKTMAISVKKDGQVMRFKIAALNQMEIHGFTAEVQGMAFGCGISFPVVSAVVTFKPNADSKAKTNGDIIALEFVPKSFRLE